LISNYHVVKDATKVRLLTSAGLIDAKVVQVDAANDLALLKADGRFAPQPIAASRTGALWVARWQRSVFQTSVCRGSRRGK
jgi:S1-C subfamily serine protease